MKVLMVLTSHDQLGDTGRKTGFWLEEFAAPYYAFKDAGAEIVLASPAGGQPPLDPVSDQPDFQTEQTHRFAADTAAQQALATTLKLDSVNAASDTRWMALLAGSIPVLNTPPPVSSLPSGAAGGAVATACR